MRYNLHTHSFYCGHGSGRIGEYCDEAERNGFSLLGFSEHCPFPDGLLSRSRMPFPSMELYERDVRSERRPFSILLGYEVDYFRSRRSYYERLKERVDYLIGGTHYIFRPDGSMASVFDSLLSGDDIRRYADQTVRAMSSGLFSFYAHPDVYLSERPFGKDEEAAAALILDAAAEHLLKIDVENEFVRHFKRRGNPPDLFGGFAGYGMLLDAVVKAVASGIAYLTEDRQRSGIIQPFPLAWNCADRRAQRRQPAEGRDCEKPGSFAGNLSFRRTDARNRHQIQKRHLFFHQRTGAPRDGVPHHILRS